MIETSNGVRGVWNHKRLGHSNHFRYLVILALLLFDEFQQRGHAQALRGERIGGTPYVSKLDVLMRARAGIGL